MLAAPSSRPRGTRDGQNPERPERKVILLWHNRRVNAYCQAQQVMCLGRTPSLAAQAVHTPVYFTDDFHPNALGHQVIATAVTEHIITPITHLLQTNRFANP